MYHKRLCAYLPFQTFADVIKNFSDEESWRPRITESSDRRESGKKLWHFGNFGNLRERGAPSLQNKIYQV